MSHPTLVGFVGGPYDGHEQAFSAPPEDLFRRMALPVNRNVFRVLAGVPRGPEAPATSVAIYELANDGGNWRYRYSGSRLAEDFNLGNWRV